MYLQAFEIKKVNLYLSPVIILTVIVFMIDIISMPRISLTHIKPSSSSQEIPSASSDQEIAP